MDGVSMRYTFDAPDAPDRRRTQYFEMCANRGIYHEGWMAVTRHGTPWEMVPTGRRPFSDDVWELYDLTRDWTQAHDLAREHPDRLRALQDLFLVEAAKNQVFPLDDRVTERENPVLAGRVDLFDGRRSVTYRGRMRRFTEETSPNVKNRSHSIVADVEIATGGAAAAGGAEGVIIAQGGRFGGWSLYCVRGCVHYAYNYFGMRHYRVLASEPVPPGRHEIRMDFRYDGSGVGKGGTVVLEVDGEKRAEGRVEQTIPYYFSFDETLDVGVDLGTPVTDDYPEAGNGFSGVLHTVRLDLGEIDLGDERGDRLDAGLRRRVMTSQ
jgi:arylsulfatase